MTARRMKVIEKTTDIRAAVTDNTAHASARFCSNIQNRSSAG